MYQPRQNYLNDKHYMYVLLYSERLDGSFVIYIVYSAHQCCRIGTACLLSGVHFHSRLMPPNAREIDQGRKKRVMSTHTYTNSYIGHRIPRR